MLELRPITQKDAFAFVAAHHRHHKPPVGTLWQHGVCFVVWRWSAGLSLENWTMVLHARLHACALMARRMLAQCSMQQRGELHRARDTVAF